MKEGLLEKTDRGWVIKETISKTSYSKMVSVHPLHPKDVAEINEQSKIFDHVEARISAYPEVMFELVNEYIDGHTNLVQQYAKLIKK